MKRRLFLLLALAALTASPALAQGKPAAKTAAGKTAQATPHRIEYEMVAADTAQHAGLMRQLNNIKRGWLCAQIEVVVHDKALNMLVTDQSTKMAAINELQAKGVVFAACENTMHAHRVEKAQLIPGVITVPMGVGEIILKQEEGWSYIRF